MTRSLHVRRQLSAAVDYNQITHISHLTACSFEYYMLVDLANNLLLSVNDRQIYIQTSREIGRILQNRLLENLDLQRNKLLEDNKNFIYRLQVNSFINRNKKQIQNSSTEQLITQVFNMGQVKMDSQGNIISDSLFLNYKDKSLQN